MREKGQNNGTVNIFLKKSITANLLFFNNGYFGVTYSQRSAFLFDNQKVRIFAVTIGNQD